jgi:hypothetical protein
MLYWAGPDRIVYAGGATALHPQPPIEGIWNFEMPEDLVEEYDYPTVSREDKEKILGRNALRLLDKDPEQVEKDIEGDRWDQLRTEREETNDFPAEPWSTYEVDATATADD